jgi:hypothetical protein
MLINYTNISKKNIPPKRDIIFFNLELQVY